jgi:CxxC-x17-CxxC domain-containing protein
MNNFKSGGGFGGRKGGSDFPRRDSGGRDFNRDRGGNSFARPTTMYQAVCADCGQPCEVPFKPSGDRPVYCSNCFKSKDVSSPRQFGAREFSKPNFRDNARPAFNDKKTFNRDDRSHSDGNRSQNAGGANQSFNEQFSMLNAKLDKVLRSLNLELDTTSTLKATPTIKAPVALKAEPIKVVKNSKKPAGPKAVVKKSVAPKKAKKK